MPTVADAGGRGDMLAGIEFRTHDGSSAIDDDLSEAFPEVWR